MKSLALLSALSVPAVAIASVLTMPPRTASAKEEYARKEGKACAFCHVSPKGGGARNSKGQEYEKNGHKFLTAAPAPGKSSGGFGEDNAFKSEANAKQYSLVLAAIQFEHWGDALRRIADLSSKEDKKGPAFEKITKAASTVDGHGRDLIRAAKEAIQGGKAPEAAAALVRVEVEFKGRDPSKDLAKNRADLLKLPGGSDADKKAHADEPLRLMLLDAKMKCADNDNAGAKKLLSDLLAKSPEGPFSAEAKGKLDELESAAGAAMDK